MRILFAGGGTGGHINPALAVAKYIIAREPGSEILYVGAVGGMEEKLVPQAGFEIKSIRVRGFQRSFAPKDIIWNVKAALYALTASGESKKILQEFKPDICMGTGGYVSGPILRQAAKMGIPIVIHESNAYPGVTSKMLAPHAKAIMIACEDAKKFFDQEKCVLTGNPVRPEIIRANREESRRKLGLDDRPVILSFGGSLGARPINEAVAELLVRSSKDQRFQHIHGYGQFSRWMPDLLREKGMDIENSKNIDVREYIHNMDECLSAADLVICRAGAITLSELQVQGKAAVLIPSPYVAENHQYHNAMAMVNKNAAAIIEEKNLTGKTLIETVDQIFASPKGAQEMGENAQKMAILDVNERIYQTIRKVLKENS